VSVTTTTHSKTDILLCVGLMTNALISVGDNTNRELESKILSGYKLTT